MTLTLLVIVLAAASIVLTLTINRPATDEPRVFALHVQQLWAVRRYR